MSDDLAHIKFAAKTWEIKENPVSPAEFLISILLTAATGLPVVDVEAIKGRVLKEGIRAYANNNVETEMLTALRLALLRAETEREQNRVRADHYQAEYSKARATILELERELEDKRKTLGFLERGLSRKALLA